MCLVMCRTGAYYTNQLNFFRDFSLKVGVPIIEVCVLWANFYGSLCCSQTERLCDSGWAANWRPATSHSRWVGCRGRRPKCRQTSAEYEDAGQKSARRGTAGFGFCKWLHQWCPQGKVLVSRSLQDKNHFLILGLGSVLRRLVSELVGLLRQLS